MKKSIYIFCLLVFILVSCQRTSDIEQSDSFARGADISWLPQMEESGYTFYNDSATNTGRKEFQMKAFIADRKSVV